jgi:tungstate transport system ATP-binding protein
LTVHGLVKPSILPLELDQVVFQARGQRLIDAVSLSLAAGPRTVILGPNGAGKSLLLRLCHGLLRPTSGSVRWVGPAAANGGVRRRQAMVFQRPVMLRRSALANIRFALAATRYDRRDRDAAALSALERFGLSPIATRPARVLSGGEQQRLALARAWALRPDVLFLDEPTAALDPAGTRGVEQAVEAFRAAGTKIVMTTHDLGQARRLADEILFLFKGRVLERTPAPLFFDAPHTPEARAFLRGDLIW